MSRPDYFGWALNICFLSNASGIFLDLIHEEGINKTLSPEEVSLIGAGLEKLARIRVHRFGTVSLLSCNESTSPEVLYLAVKHALRLMNDNLEKLGPSSAKKAAQLFSPHLFLLQDVDLVPQGTQISLTEMILSKRLSPPTGGVGLIDYLELPLHFVLVATSTRLPYPGKGIQERLLNGFLLRLPLVLLSQKEGGTEKQPTSSHPPFSHEDFLRLLPLVSGVYLPLALVRQVRAIISCLYEANQVKIGPSPKAVDAVCLALRAQAAMQGRNFATPSDLSQVVVETLAHRFQIVEHDPVSFVHPVQEARKLVVTLLSTLPGV